MPTYEYACSRCGNHFEKFQSMRDKPLRKCPKCSKAGLKRLVGRGAGLIFKGSGFYINDYRRQGQAKPVAAESKAGPETKPAGDSKPAGSPAVGISKGAPAPADTSGK